MCPGALLDSLYHGSKPILASTGKQIVVTVVEVMEQVEVEGLATSLTLDQSVEDLDLNTIAAQLAALYGIDPSAIRLVPSGGSVVIEMQLVASAGTSLAALAAIVLAVGDAALSLAIGSSAVRSAVISQVALNETVRRNQTREMEVDCPTGHWW